MKLNKNWIAACFFGLLLLVIGNIIIGFFPSHAHNIASGYGSPVFAFEMARTSQDLINVFGPTDTPAREVRIAAMNTGNLWDFPFMVIYSGFIATFFLGAYSASRQKMLLGLSALGLVSGIADAVENFILLGLTKNLEVAHNIQFLPYPVWIKFFAIMVTAIGAGVFIAQQSSPLWRVTGILAALSAATILITFSDAEKYGFLLQFSITISWLVMLVFSFTQLVKP